jgi:hypothetical protein
VLSCESRSAHVTVSKLGSIIPIHVEMVGKISTIFDREVSKVLKVDSPVHIIGTRADFHRKLSELFKIGLLPRYEEQVS